MNNNTYKLVNENDPNNHTELTSTTFQDAVEEALYNLEWYVVNEGEYFVACNEQDPNDTIELTEFEFEDAQYETIEKLGYYVAAPL